MTGAPTLILASASPYRRELLSRLGVEFRVRPADVDEGRLPGEAPLDMARRLAAVKARAAATGQPGLVIGSDQVAALGDEVLAKPGDRGRAMDQLRRQSGRTVLFHTALCLLDTERGFESVAVETVRVRFRQLDDAEIGRYLDADEPYDCAGSFKSESLGISLCEGIECSDPTALVGLPLIRLGAMLREAGMEVP